MSQDLLIVLPRPGAHLESSGRWWGIMKTFPGGSSWLQLHSTLCGHFGGREIWLERNSECACIALSFYLYWSTTRERGGWHSESLDSFHRRQLRTLLGIKWPQRIRNSALYERCQCESLSSLIRKNRWRLFGHILRLLDNTPAKLSMIHYFKSTERKWRGRPRITLPLRLAEDMAAVGAGTLNTIADLRRLEMLSCDRSSWREVVTKICER